MTKQTTTQDAVAKYYSRLGSRIGYKLVMKKGQHFGLYDAKHTDESSAQNNFHEHIGDLLNLSKGMEVLDAGSGQGVLAVFLAKKYDVQVTGITIVPYEVKTATKLSKKEGVHDLTTFKLADFSNPDLRPRSFDRIYTTETLSHAPDVVATLKVFMRLLKPGGKLVCAEYEFDYDRFGDEQRQDAEFAKKYAAIHGIYQLGKGEFTESLKNVGFKECREIDWTERVRPSFERLERLARPIATVVKKLKMDRHFINTVSAAMYSKAYRKGAFRLKVYTATKPTP